MPVFLLQTYNIYKIYIRDSNFKCFVSNTATDSIIFIRYGNLPKIHFEIILHININFNISRILFANILN